MTTAIQPEFPAVPVTGFPYRRLATDMRYAVLLSVLIAVFITLVAGKFNLAGLLEHLVFSFSIGLIAFPVIDVARLALLRRPNWGAGQWAVLAAVVLAAAPVATYGGLWLACSILGYPGPATNDIIMGKQTNNVLITVFGGSAGMLLFVNQERMARVEAEAARERARAEAVARQAAQAQLQLLQAQIEPHMLFNTLANLQGLIALDPGRASHMLDQLIRFLRATLSSSRSEATTLAQEFDLLDAYLGLMAVRMGTRLRFSLHLADDLRDAAVPPMLLQPLVENAIAHGLEPKVDGGELVVTAQRRGDLLELTVRDTGLGLDAAPPRPGTGLGLANTRERLRGLYGEHATVALEPAAPQGTVARITLPMEPA